MNTAASAAYANPAASPGLALSELADLLTWIPGCHDPLAWRNAFEKELERRVHAVLSESETDNYLQQSLALLPAAARGRFLCAPTVASMLRCHVGNQFDDRIFARLLLAEAAAAGIVSELPEPLWTARGDRLLEPGQPECWTRPEIRVADTDITLDLNSPYDFPDDEFGLAGTVPHGSGQAAIASRKVTQAIDALRRACPRALRLVTSLIEVLALRREEVESANFYSSTFPGRPGLVRFTNTHRNEAGPNDVIEALVHESIHCILHVCEEMEEPFVRTEDASHTKVKSPWTGDTIRLQSYVHACAVWYGLYWLWSADGFAAGPPDPGMDSLRERASHGFQFRPVTVGLARFRALLTNSVWELLLELEERMLPAAS